VSPDKGVTITEEEKQESLLWEEYLEEGEYDYQRPKRGEIRDGIILRKDEDQIIVDIGAKREGIVPQKDLEKIGPETVAELSVGDEISVYVLSPESRDGDVIVSINMARQMADWDQAEKLMRSDEILEKKVTGFNKGGILVQVGQIQGFIPRSHIVDLSGRTKPGTPQERLSQMIGQELPLENYRSQPAAAPPDSLRTGSVARVARRAEKAPAGRARSKRCSNGHSNQPGRVWRLCRPRWC